MTFSKVILFSQSETILFHSLLFKSSPSTVSGMWESRSLFSIECERWKYISKIFSCCHFWEWQWPVSVGCVPSCCLDAMSCYWMSQCHSVLLLNTYSSFGTILNRKKLFFSLFKEIWVSFLCWETPNAEGLLLIMKGTEGKVVQKTEQLSVPRGLKLGPYNISKFSLFP